MARGKGILPACVMAEGQLRILSRALKGNSTTKKTRSSSGVKSLIQVIASPDPL